MNNLSIVKIKFEPQKCDIIFVFYNYFEKFKSIKKLIMKCFKEIGHGELKKYWPYKGFVMKKKNCVRNFTKFYFVLKNGGHV